MLSRDGIGCNDVRMYRTVLHIHIDLDLETAVCERSMTEIYILIPGDSSIHQNAENDVVV